MLSVIELQESTQARISQGYVIIDAWKLLADQFALAAVASLPDYSQIPGVGDTPEDIARKADYFKAEAKRLSVLRAAHEISSAAARADLADSRATLVEAIAEWEAKPPEAQPGPTLYALRETLGLVDSVTASIAFWQDDCAKQEGEFKLAGESLARLTTPGALDAALALLRSYAVALPILAVAAAGAVGLGLLIYFRRGRR